MDFIDFDPNEPPEPEPPPPNREPIKIAVETEISFGEVLDRIAYQARASFRGHYGEDALGRIIERTITKAVEKRAAKLVEARVDAAVDRILTEGWTEHGSYGEPKGGPVTLESLVRKLLTTKSRASYDGPEKTAIERKLDAFLDREVPSAMKQELDEARARFRAAVDKLIESKVLEAARAALKGG